MSYAVKDIFYTLQGEGARAGQAAVFCRFSGCNLWSGREEDRADAICNFCDTDFVGTSGRGGGRFATAEELAEAVAASRPKVRSPGARPFVVCTGGEPLLQLDEPLTRALHGKSFEIAVETNGTQVLPPGVDWICVSPKANTDLVLRAGNELKLVYPQPDLSPRSFENLDFDQFFLQPMDGKDQERNTALAVEYCLKHPQWKLSLQLHKLLRIP